MVLELKVVKKSEKTNLNQPGSLKNGYLTVEMTGQQAKLNIPEGVGDCLVWVDIDIGVVVGSVIEGVGDGGVLHSRLGFCSH